MKDSAQIVCITVSVTQSAKARLAERPQVSAEDRTLTFAGVWWLAVVNPFLSSGFWATKTGYLHSLNVQYGALSGSAALGKGLDMHGALFDDGCSIQ